MHYTHLVYEVSHLPRDVSPSGLSASLYALLRLKKCCEEKKSLDTLHKVLLDEKVQIHLPVCLRNQSLGVSQIKTLQGVQKVALLLKKTGFSCFSTKKLSRHVWYSFPKKKSHLDWNLFAHRDTAVKLYALGAKVGSGSFKTVRTLVSLSDNVSFALAHLHKEIRSIPRCSLQKEIALSKRLHEAHVPYILRLWFFASLQTQTVLQCHKKR